MTSSEFSFCPECSTLLEPVNNLNNDEDIVEDDEKLYLQCHNCMYYEEAKMFSIKYYDNSKNNNISTIKHNRIGDYKYDPTYLRTKSISCINEKCSSIGKSNPEIILITSENHPEYGFMCSECTYTWGQL